MNTIKSVHTFITSRKLNTANVENQTDTKNKSFTAKSGELDLNPTKHLNSSEELKQTKQLSLNEELESTKHLNVELNSHTTLTFEPVTEVKVNPENLNKQLPVDIKIKLEPGILESSKAEIDLGTKTLDKRGIPENDDDKRKKKKPKKV